MALSYTSICRLFKDELSVFSRGEKHLNSSDVLHFQQFGTHYEFSIRASMKKKEYAVEVCQCSISYNVCCKGHCVERKRIENEYVKLSSVTDI